MADQATLLRTAGVWGVKWIVFYCAELVVLFKGND